MGDSVGELVELFIGEGLVLEANGLGLGCLVDLLLKQAGEGGGLSVVGAGLVEGVDELLSLVVAQQICVVEFFSVCCVSASSVRR